MIVPKKKLTNKY